MENQGEFWQRPVVDTLVLELVPGEQPVLLINNNGQTALRLGFAEARRLIDALTVAVGELLILKKDPAALSRVNELLAGDVTLLDREQQGRVSAAHHGSTSQAKGQELIRRYKHGDRSFPRADLSGADLEGTDLRGIDLRGADLTRANLRRANLFQANLREANLSQAMLEEAGLFQSDLRGADLSKANLERAFLRKANLRSAKVSREQLAVASALDGAIMPDGRRRS
jgi:uncharacterized protein YjbI with pentapeptide repeats